MPSAVAADSCEVLYCHDECIQAAGWARVSLTHPALLSESPARSSIARDGSSEAGPKGN